MRDKTESRSKQIDAGNRPDGTIAAVCLGQPREILFGSDHRND